MGRLSDNVDGFVVDQYAATFSGTTEIDLPDARYMAFDDEILVVARVRVKMPRLKEARNGDITRVNVLGVKELALVRSEQLREHLCQTLGMDSPQQLTLPEATPVPVTDVSTSETESLEELASPTEVFSPISRDDRPRVSALSVAEADSMDGRTRGPVPAKEDGALASFLQDSMR